MRAGRCFIIGAGDFTARDLCPEPGDMLIAADGGLAPLNRLGLRPHAAVGDMDSFSGPIVGLPFLRFPARKDDTDLALAIRLGRSRGFSRFLLYGASGGAREDHFIAALQLMGGLCERGLSLRLIAPAFTLYALRDRHIIIPTKPGCTVSVFSHSGYSRGVRLKGLSYEGESLTLLRGNPHGVSNRALGTRALIGVKDGTLLVFAAEEADKT